MRKTAKSKAEEQFAAIQKKTEKIRNEDEKARHERSQHVAKLRALRMAKEAEDKQVAAQEKQKKAAAKSK